MRQRPAILLTMTAIAVAVSCTPSEEVGKAFEATASLFELNTKVHRFVALPDSNNFTTEFGGYKIEVFIQAVKPRDLEGIDSFRVSVDAWYKEKVGNRSEALATGGLLLDSLQIEMASDETETTIRALRVKATDDDQRMTEPIIRRKRLRGPTYRYELLRIPDEIESINLFFVASVLDRETGDTVNSQRIEQPLYRYTTLKYY